MGEGRAGSGRCLLSVYVCMYICMYVYMYVCVYVYMYVCVYVRVYVCVHVCMYVYIYGISRSLEGRVRVAPLRIGSALVQSDMFSIIASS